MSETFLIHNTLNVSYVPVACRSWHHGLIWCEIGGGNMGVLCTLLQG